MAGQEDPVQREIHQDWANREYIEIITSSIKKIADFLNSFGGSSHHSLLITFPQKKDQSRIDMSYFTKAFLSNSDEHGLLNLYPKREMITEDQLYMSCRSRLATLNEKLTALERRIEYIEARVTKGETLT